MTTDGHIDDSTFDDCLARGFGRVILYLRGRDHKPFRESIVYACGHDLAFDKQCEDTREVYLCDILDATGQVEEYARVIIDLLNSRDPDLSLLQLYGVVGKLAARGFRDARRAMYERLESDLAVGDSTGADAVIQLDGVHGFLFLISQSLRLADGPRDEFFSEYLLLEQAYKRDGVEKVQSALMHAGELNPGLKSYLTSIELQWRDWQRGLHSRDSKRALSYSAVRALMDRTDEPFKPHYWWRIGKRATGRCLDLIARDLEHEMDRLMLLKMMALFWRRDYRGNIEPLLELAQSTDAQLSRGALHILEKIADDRVRALGLNLVLVTNSASIIRGLQLLGAAGRVSDYPLLRELLTRDYSEADFHHTGILMRRIIEHCPSPEAATILEELYERGRCTTCRCSTVERMMDCETIPDWVVREAIFDADTSTRKSIGEWSHAPEQ